MGLVGKDTKLAGCVDILVECYKKKHAPLVLWWAKCTSEGSVTVAEDAGVKRAERGDEGVIAPRAASSFLGSWIAFRSQFVRSDRSCCLICGTFGLLACGYI